MQAARFAVARYVRLSALAAGLVAVASCVSSTNALRAGHTAEINMDFDRAVVEYTRAVRTHPDNQEARLALDRAKLRAAEEHFRNRSRRCRESQLRQQRFLCGNQGQ